MTPANAKDRPSRATEGFFGRRHGKTIRPQQAIALESGLREYRLDLTAQAPADLSTLFKAEVSALQLEIGFGGGEHLLHRAKEAQGTGFIGVEPFVNGMAKMMTALAKNPLGNLRVYDDDATRLLDWLPSGSLDGIDLLYPDPWPKKKHWKRRFVGAANLGRFARVLKPGGRFRFASDIDSYVNWTLLACRAHGGFAWQAGEAADWHQPYEGWPGTRYEAKAIREGRRPAYLTFIRK
ncbi:MULTISPECIES: tRNA (guanosine(46)-N(7))-methyltransferase TrmB [unclassified Mesorhizobium]|uniref:tRNA (guanine(46)-N(7))-methyltransferase TrmB n=1 Tax=unclassified Mesorhizobium TaxID=325217 RepID=UPI000F75EAA2|nr:MULTISPECIES: tRNA (guanosine(46)-N(7))-methyltransferase TrmB [unclassified Mesorhizobium]AZO05276.1 tRNA (guanosine(46)-N7)-methyltransferase TrmB [Mesorhizobium sp. M2A.F.Ca.ET.043.02.1.1]RUW41844.1 tRNA (guanosine(46)-N7)-methyltransferase TrmB [Mesorhizobium sp. M2A.F.Ca.ET.015.02.1.1]RUW79580.1 tRNA (guanosine(46)-N7)-methyltransferase TrmB [Mesorhizobium sp. M2A.F.Ca.ET.067.02.1.1]RVC96617.1 tRNA (guanosine(46)-N7)-methyltransferase TrmB [Mesorhizobium sp. M2A.F.Ca.ET.017.03.2.1]RVD0